MPWECQAYGHFSHKKSRDHEIVRAQKKVSKGRLQNHVV